MKIVALAAIGLVMLIASCKSTTKLYDEGQYDKAVYSALDDLRKNSGNTSAGEILPQAYRQARSRYLQSVTAASAGIPNAQKLDVIYRDYLGLDKLYQAIAATPAAFRFVQAGSYTVELTQAAEAAAAFNYDQGVGYMQQSNRLAAQKGYEAFKRAAGYEPGYKDLEERMADAYDKAVVNVIVDKFDQRFGNYSLDAGYFRNDILRNLNSIGNSRYYRFYSTADPKAREVRADQFMDINVYDIRFGEMAVNRDSYTVTRDLTEKDPADPKKTVTTTVRATVNVIRRVIVSNASMDYRIVDQESRRMIDNNRFFAEYTWEKVTGGFTGDQRALGDKDWAVVRGVYNNQPGYDALYRELTSQLMNQFNARMRDIYSRSY